MPGYSECNVSAAPAARPLTLGCESAAAFRPQKWLMPSDTLWALFASFLLKTLALCTALEFALL